MSARDDSVVGTPEDEQYEPSVIAEAERQQLVTQLVNEVSQNLGLRVQAADIATRIPWNPTEPVTEDTITKRFDAVFNWVTDLTVDTNSK